jgi:DNA-binding SARP family transcriptional activator
MGASRRVHARILAARMGHAHRSAVAIQLITLGGLRADAESGELDWLLAQHSRAALFVYLAVERRVSRESLMTVFWPESDAENARHALRQSLYQLRKAVGSDWIESRAHELAVTGDIRCDAHEFTDAIDRGDLDSAVRAYRGPFLDGVHLVALTTWETWVDAKRAQLARAFRIACRDLLATKRAAGDLKGAVTAAELWVARDQTDNEAQHRLIETLAAAGERAEAIRQYETYARLLEPDGLRPLDETLELVQRLRLDPTPLPVMARTIDDGWGTTDEGRGTTDGERSPPDEQRRNSWRFLTVAAGLLVLLGSAWVWRERVPSVVPRPSSDVIAVLPFSTRGGGGVAYLSQGIVNLLGAALDGAGSLRPADTRAVFAAVDDAGGAASVRPNAETIATKLRAGLYVLGDVVEAGDQVQLDAAIYRVGSREAVSRVVVSGAADSVFTLVDRLAARLLGDLGQPAADHLVRTASVTTPSLQAFKAYLQGEALMRAGQFERAAESYAEAIARDSGFAVAHYRLGLAREWAPLPGEAEAANAAARHAARLSPRDRARLEAFREWRAGRAIEAERAYRAILARYPDDVDAWFQLGEIEFHHGPLLGHRLDESEEAWRKVLSYEPRSLFALIHLGRIAIVGRRVAALDSLLASFKPEELRADRRLFELVVLRALTVGDSVAARSLVGTMRAWEDLSVWRLMVFVAAFSPDPLITSPLVHDVMGDGASPALRADVRWFNSLLDLASGRASAAERSRTEAASDERRVSADHRRERFDAVTEWFAATLPLPYSDAVLSRVRLRAASLPDLSSARQGFFESETGLGAPIQLEPVRQYTIGILSLRLRDTTSATAAAITLRRLAARDSTTVLTRDLDRGLRAAIAEHAGRPKEALDLLQAMESRDSQGDVAAIPFVSRPNERFLRAEVLATLGREREALQWLAALGDGSITEIPLRAPSHLRQAEIYERLGERDLAGAHYQRFAELWSRSDAEFQRLVAAAKQRLAGLGAER